MQKRYELSVPQTVFGGVGALQNISRVLKDNHVKKVALFTGKRVRAAGLLDALIYAGSALSGTLAGLICDHYGWNAVFASWMLCSSASVVLILLSARKRWSI